MKQYIFTVIFLWYLLLLNSAFALPCMKKLPWPQPELTSSTLRLVMNYYLEAKK